MNSETDIDVHLQPVQAQALLDSSAHLDWYHKFEVVAGSGVYTPGRLDTKGYKWRQEFVGLSRDFLRDKRVLDIGAYTGAFSFLLEDLGAKEVVAVDVYDPDRNGFSLVHRLRRSGVKHARVSIYDLDPRQLGQFDIVACYGVHYHLRHPILALERCNAVCKDGGLFIGGGTGMDAWFHDEDETCGRGANFSRIRRELLTDDSILSVATANDLAICGYAPKQFFRDKSNWFIPNMICLAAWVESCGFAVEKTHVHNTEIPRSWNVTGIQRSALNFVARKTGSPLKEYEWAPMRSYEIATAYDLEMARERITQLEQQVRTLGGIPR
jgi:SAM-dependent methyltransferase